MATTFPVEVMTPEGAAYEGECELVSTHTVVGSIGIRANHEPLMALLEPTELRLFESESEVKRFAQGEGYIQMANNSLLVLVEEAIPVEELDAADLQQKVDASQGRLDAAEEDSADAERALRDVKRWQKYLDIANAQ